MTAELKRIHAKLEDTVAAPLTTEKAARMAESIRSVFNTNGNVLRFLPDPVEGGAQGFSITDWMVVATPGSNGRVMSNAPAYFAVPTPSVRLVRRPAAS